MNLMLLAVEIVWPEAVMFVGVAAAGAYAFGKMCCS